MLAVVFLLTFTLLAAADSPLTTFETCAKVVRKDKPSPSLLTPGDVPGYCNKVRFEVARCIGSKMKIKEDGSLASRGKILVDLIPQTNNSKELIQMARMYHYGCVYNDVGIWLRNQTCFDYMLQRCVLSGTDDCYGLVCRPKDNPSVLKGSKENTNLSPSFTFPAIATVVIAMIYW